eukprot:GHVL01018457.1.p1 GENE.GHVL01018457.1~~GHVL01018457.1.p1  ORF type:complete len:1150 (+),score=170.16 GHVL01018457.1:27-3476(+)
MIDEYYDGAEIFVTGSTGFVGKVLLERLLATVNVNKIYCLIRAKTGSAHERLSRQILSSPAFDVLRAARPDFDTWVHSKVIPFAGDISQENLGLSAEDHRTICDRVSVIFGVAASVEFNVPVETAIETNIKGPQRVLKLAKECKHLRVYVHVSTAYVNADKKGPISETVYPIHIDPLEALTALRDAKTDKSLKKVMGGFPNMYTFSKAVAEHLLCRNRGNVRLAICRPTIVGAAWRDPLPGWVDSVVASGAMYLAVGLGLLRRAQGDMNLIGDQIPVDFVVNHAIVSAVIHSQAEPGSLWVFHSASSDKNPVKWGEAGEALISAWRQHPPKKSVRKASFFMTPSTLKVWTLRTIEERIPMELLRRIAQIVPSRRLDTLQKKYSKNLARAQYIARTFEHFINREWVFQSNGIEYMYQKMTQAERELLPVDVCVINWHEYHAFFCYGLKKHILQEEAEPPSTNILMHPAVRKIVPQWFRDVKWAANAMPTDRWFRGSTETKHIVLNSFKVQQVINHEAEKAKTQPGRPPRSRAHFQSVAETYLDEIAASFNRPVQRFMGWSMDKIFKTIFEKVVIEEKELIKIKEASNNSRVPILILPSHRSYVDFLIVSYIFFAFDLKLPLVAAGDDFRKISIITHMFRNSGAFFMRRGFRAESDPLYTACFKTYFQHVLKEHGLVEFFLEGRRSRSGLMLNSKKGLFKMASELYFDGEVEDIKLLPMAISYDRVVEGETYSRELMGESKLKESLTRTVRAASILGESFGRVYVKFCDLISLDEYCCNKYGKKSAITPQNKNQIIESMATECCLRAADEMVITPTSLVATILLIYRKGLREDDLVNEVEWVRDAIAQRRGFLASNLTGGCATAVRTSCNFLNKQIEKKKDVFDPIVSPKEDILAILTLGYYRNQLIHLFLNEAFVSLCLLSFGYQMLWQEGIPLDRLHQEADFLWNILRQNFVVRENNAATILEETLHSMTNRTLIRRNVTDDGQTVFVMSSTGERMFMLLCSLLWPFVDTVWVAALSLLFLQESGANGSNLAARTNNQTKTNSQVVGTLPWLIGQAQWLAETMCEERLLSHSESSATTAISEAFKILENLQVISINKLSNKVTLQPNFLKQQELQSFLDHIATFRKESYSNVNTGRRPLITKFPINSRM